MPHLSHLGLPGTFCGHAGPPWRPSAPGWVECGEVKEGTFAGPRCAHPPQTRHVPAAGGPGGREDRCFHAPCSTVAARARGLACLLGAWTVSAALVLLSVACPHPGCPGDCPGPWSPITGECPRRVWDQVWARRAPGCGCFGSLRDCGEADITLPSPRENSWGMTLPFAVTAPPPGCVLGTVGAAGPAGCGPG